MIRRIVTAAAAGLAAGVLALAGTAHAHHNLPNLTVGEPGECGQVTIATAWIGDDHQVANAALVVQAAGAQHTADIGEEITVGPFDTDTATIRYRVWGGGERDYDQPPLADLAALVAYLEADAGHSPLNEDAPGLAWHELDVDGCAPDPEPSKPGLEPTSDPSDPADAGKGGGDESLPATSGLTALTTLSGTALVLLVAGAAAMVAARRRRAVPLD